MIRYSKLLDDIQIIFTFGVSSPEAIALQRKIDSYSSSQLINIGPVAAKYLSHLYSSVSAVILPSLLESQSGIFSEASFYRLPMLASDMDFVHNQSYGNLFLFDPLDIHDIFTVISSFRTAHISASSCCPVHTWKESVQPLFNLLES